MIILNHLKGNRKFEEKLKKYQNLINYGSLECPHCHSKEYIKWGFYERGVTFIKNGIPYSTIIKIKRIRCKSCNSTHALLPFGITPYKQLTDEILIPLLLGDYLDFFSEDTVKYYNRQFKKFHYPNLSTLLHMQDSVQILKQLKKEKEQILERYIKLFNMCFMQIKLGWLGYCSFLEGAPT